jgi:hypothetical protein
MPLEDPHRMIAEPRLEVRQLAVWRRVGAQLEHPAGILGVCDRGLMPGAEGKADCQQHERRQDTKRVQ